MKLEPGWRGWWLPKLDVANMPENEKLPAKARQPIVLAERAYVEMTPGEREQRALAALIRWWDETDRPTPTRAARAASTPTRKIGVPSGTPSTERDHRCHGDNTSLYAISSEPSQRRNYRCSVATEHRTSIGLTRRGIPIQIPTGTSLFAVSTAGTSQAAGAQNHGCPKGHQRQATFSWSRPSDLGPRPQPNDI